MLPPSGSSRWSPIRTLLAVLLPARGPHPLRRLWHHAAQMEQIEGLTLTPRLRRSLRAAAKAAHDRGHSFLGTEHVLLGLLAEPDGIAAQVHDC
jgi:hypothetical protein